MGSLLNSSEIPENANILDSNPVIRNTLTEHQVDSIAAHTILQDKDADALASSTQLEETGRSNLVRDTQDKAKADDFRDMLSIVSDPTLTQEQVQGIINQYKARTGEIVMPHDYNRANLSLQEPSVDDTQELVLRERYDAYHTLMQTNSKIEELTQQFVREKATTGTVGATAEFYEAGLLPYYTKYYFGVTQHLKEKGWLKDTRILPGSAAEDIINAAKKLPQEKKVEFFKDFLDGISKTSGILGDDNHYVAFSIATEMADKLQTGQDLGFIHKWLGNLDVLPFIQMGVGSAKRIGNVIKTADGMHLPSTTPTPASPVSVAASAAPNTSSLVLSKAVTNVKAAKALATTPEKLVEWLTVPKAHEFDYTSAPADLIESLKKLERQGDELYAKTLHDGFILTPSDMSHAQQVAQAELKTLGEKIPEAHLHNTMIEYQTEDAFVVSQMFGHGNTGWSRPAEAIEAAKDAQVFDTASAGFEILKFDPKKNEYKVIYSGAKQNSFNDVVGEYFIRYRQAKTYKPTDIFSFTPMDVKKQGIVATVFNDYTQFKGVESILSRWYAGNTSTGYASAKAAAKESLDLISKSFLKLNGKSQLRVMQAVDDGANYRNDVGDVIGKEWSYSDLSSGPYNLTDDEIKGYFSVRNLAKTSRDILDRDFRKELLETGYWRFQDGNVDTIGKRIAEVADAKKLPIKKVYDPYTKSTRLVTPDILDNLYKSGTELIKLRIPARLGSDKFEYAVIKNAKSSQYELPLSIIGDRPGYYPRINEENFYIDLYDSKAQVNGVETGTANPHVTTVHVASNKVEAQQLVAKLNKEAKAGSRYEYRPAKELSTDIDKINIEAVRGQLYYSGKGDRLTGTEGRVSNIVDPIRALEIQKNYISRHVASDKVISQLEAAWNVAFSKFAREPGTLPRVRGDIVYKSEFPEQEFHKAQAMWDLINLYKTVGGENRVYRSVMSNLALWADDKLPDALVQGLYSSGRSGKSPITRGVSVAFNILLAGNPAAQIWKQGMQHTYLGMLSPTKFAKSYQYMAAYGNVALYNMTGSKKTLTAAAKILGTTEEEAKDVYNMLRTSGLFKQVDDHQYVSAAFLDTTANVWQHSGPKYVARKATDSVAGAFNLGRKVGFDSGEKTNQGMTFFFAFQQVKEEYAAAGKVFDLKSSKLQDEIVGRTNLLTFNMNQSGQMGTNRGWLRAAGQFWTFRIKSLQNALPGSYGSLQGNEKIKYAVLSSLLYGTAGWGLREWYLKTKLETGAEVSPEMDELIQGGLAEMELNREMNDWFGNDEEVKTRLAWSEAISPLSGSAFWSSLDMDSPLAMSLLGASAGVSKKMYETTRDSLFLALHYSEDDWENKLIAVSAHSSSLVPLMNNTLKYYLWKKTRTLYDSHLSDTGIKINANEAALKIFGVRTVAEVENRVLHSMSERKADLEEAGRRYADLILESTKLTTDSKDTDMDAFAAVLNMVDDESDKMVIRQAMNKRFNQHRVDELGTIALLLRRRAKASGVPLENLRSFLESSDLDSRMKQPTLDMIDFINAKEEE